MKASMTAKKSAAIVAAASLLLTLLAVLPAFSKTASAADLSAEERAAIPANYGPIGTDNDPWVSNFPRSGGASGLNSVGNYRIALVFDFAPTYTWETMGGLMCDPYSSPTQDCRGGLRNYRNRDQANQIKAAVSRLKGAPVSMGIYTFFRGGTGTPAPANTANLNATSLQYADTFQQVINKIDSLDATDGQGNRRSGNPGSNWENGFDAVLRDSNNYREKYKAQYGKYPDKPYYSKILFFTSGNVEVSGDDDYLNVGAAQTKGAQKIIELANQGTRLNIFAIGPITFKGRVNEVVNKVNHANTKAGTVSYTYLRHEAPGLTNGNYFWQDPYNFCTSGRYNKYTYAKGSADYNACVQERKNACFNHDPIKNNWESSPNLWYIRTEQHCNQVRDGKFSDEMVKALFEDKYLTVTADVVDQNLVYHRPANDLEFSAGTITSQRTGPDGVFQIALRDQSQTSKLQITPKASYKYALTRLKLPSSTSYTPQKLPKEGNARCVAFFYQASWDTNTKSYDIFVPEAGSNGSVYLSPAQLQKYAYIKCGFYVREQRPTVLRKSVSVGNEQIRFDVLKSRFQVKWDCKDPLSVTDPNADVGHGTKQYHLDKDSNGQTIRLNTEFSFTDQPIGGSGPNLILLPTGATCKIHEDIRYPERKYGASGTGATWTKDDWDRLMSVADSSDRSILMGTSEAKSVTPNSSFDYAFETDFEVRMEQGLNSGARNSVLDLMTTFTSKKASVKLSVNFKTQDQARTAADFRKNSPRVPVYYNCRYMGDPTKPPEIPESGAEAMPGYVERGSIDVPTDGTAVYLGVKKDANGTPERDERGNLIPLWPAGAHCLFSSQPPKTAEETGGAKSSPLSVPGFDVRDSYASDICSENSSTPSSEVKSCQNNHFWVPTGGEKEVKLTQNITRKTVNVTLNKVVSGDAAAVGLEKDFTETIRCTDTGKTLIPQFTQEIRGGKSAIFQGVPAGATCTLTEEVDSTPNVLTTLPGRNGVQVFGPLTENAEFSTTTQFNYVSFQPHVQHTSNFSEDFDAEAELKQALIGLDKKVTITCRQPDGTTQGPLTKTISGGRNPADVSLEQVFKAGSKCSVTTEVLGLEDFKKTSQIQAAKRVIAENSVDQDSLTLGENKDVKVFTDYSLLPIAGAFSIVTESRNTAYESLSVPNKYNYTLTCAGSPGSIHFTLPRNGGKYIVEGNLINPNASCTLTQDTTDDPKVWRKTSMRSSGGGESQEWTAPASGNPSLTFQAPDTDGTLSVTVQNHYATATASLNFFTQTDVKTSANTNTAATVEVPAAWKAAAFRHFVAMGHGTNPSASPQEAPGGGSGTIGAGTWIDTYQVQAKLKCSNTGNGQTDTFSLNTVLTLRNGTWATSQPAVVPVGWRCELSSTLSSFKISGMDLRDSEDLPLAHDATTGANLVWQVQGGTGTQAQQKGETVSLVTRANDNGTAGNSLNLTVPYRLQLGSFTVKKKVGGEGVAMIPASHMYKVDYSCTLNGQAIGIPQAREIVKQEDATHTLPGKLAAMLLGDLAQTQSVNIGRFQQGERHLVDAIPAGAKCTLSEDPEVAKRDNSRWDNTWEITGGYRGRENIISNCSSQGTDICQYQGNSTVAATVQVPRDQRERVNDTYKAAGKNDPIVPQTLPENFVGTAVVWNDYTFEKTQVKVKYQVGGNGKRLAKSQAVKLRLYCKPPTLQANGQKVPNTLNGAAIYNTTITLQPQVGHEYEAEGVADVLLPVGYNCVIAQTTPVSYDAKVTPVLHRDAGDETTILTGDLDEYTPEKLKPQLKQLFGEIDVNGGTVDGKTYPADGNLMPTEREFLLKGFRVAKERVSPLGAGIQKQTVFDLKNTFERTAANIQVRKLLEDTPNSENLVNVSPQAAASSYQIGYACTDPYLRQASSTNPDEMVPVVYSGTLRVTPGTGATAVPNDDEENLIPASATCEFGEAFVGGVDPNAAYPAIKQTAKVKVESGTAESPVVSEFQADPDKPAIETKATGIKLDASGENPTVVTFTNGYFVSLNTLQVVTYPDGTRAKEYLPVDTTRYGYTYSCTNPALPAAVLAALGANAPTNGVLKDAQGQDALAGQLAKATVLSAATNCKVVPAALAQDVQDQLAAGGLQHLMAYLTPPNEQLMDTETGLPYAEVPRFSDVLDGEGNIQWSATQRPAIPAEGFEVSPGGDARVVLHTVYRDKAKVQVRKVDKDDRTSILGSQAAFRIFESVDGVNPKPGSQAIEVTPVLNQENVATGEFWTNLGPGSYVLEETKAGKGELLPTYWGFKVEAANTQNTNASDFGADLVVALSEIQENSGLVALKKPATDKQPWAIDVAEVSSGYLPKTGGERAWIELCGLALLATGAALTLWLRRKRIL